MSQGSSAATGHTPRIAISLRYSVFTLAYAAMVYWLSSLPEAGKGGSSPLARLAVNLYHFPLYAGLGFFALQAISRGRALAAHRWTRGALTFLAVGAVALLDEWHQVYVLGRNPSLVDVLLDLAGVATFLLVCALGTERGRRS